MLDNVNIRKTLIAGILGTAGMTGLMMMAPMMGMPSMNIGKMLGSMMGGITALGWMAHFMIGVMLSFSYTTVLVDRLPGPGVVRGMIFSLAPWLLSQIVVMPMMGSGFFSGSLIATLGSLMGHLVFGAILGTFYSLTLPCDVTNEEAKSVA